MADELAALMARAIHLSEGAGETQKAIVQTQAAIVKQQARSKRTIRLLAVSVALDIALSVVFIFLAAAQARITQQIHQSQLNACAMGNDFRLGQVRLWDHVIAVSAAPKGETPAERTARLARLAAFRGYVAARFEPVPCHRLYP